MSAFIQSLTDLDIVLVGAGHTNLHIVRMWRMNPIPNARLTVITPFSRATYSGMLPGTLAGLYAPRDMEIDLRRFVPSCGARLIVAEATGLDPSVHRVQLADRPPMRFDIASIGLGSVPGQRELWHGKPQVISIKPMATFRTRLTTAVNAAVDTGSAGAPPTPLRLVVVGAGAGGIEIALAADVWLGSRQIPAQIMLLDAHATILRGYSAGAVRAMRQELVRRGIQTMLGSRVAAVSRHGHRDAGVGNHDPVILQCEDGRRCEADVVIWATAAAAPPVLENFLLPRDPGGFLAVHPTLQSVSGEPVFAVGDTAGFVSSPLPKAGVYAVREGPVLWENLQRLCSGRPLIDYVPQRGFLSLLSLGDGRAIADYRGWSATGRWAWRWKDRIDRQFMQMFQEPFPVSMPTPMPGANSRGMRCSGCGSKVGAGVLAGALDRLGAGQATSVPVGLNRPDDAVVFDRTATPVDVLSVDFFPAFIDDPYLVGRIAALHALSDVWAMGADPCGAMAIVTLPAGNASQQTELLYQLLAGGQRELSAAGAGLWGGHTTEGPELLMGFTVAGRLDGRTPWAKGNLRQGDRLILTKPLGIGAILAANAQGAASAGDVDAAIAQMLISNASAARLARQHGVVAATDVTGFGLAGHLLEMIEASDCSARISLDRIPILAPFAAHAATGYESSLAPANRERAVQLRADSPNLLKDPRWPVLFDPQTSGGLLLAVAADQADHLVEQLRAEGCPHAEIIGEIVPGDGLPSLHATVE